MKSLLSLVVTFAFLTNVFALEANDAAKLSPTRVTPTAPKFSDSERQTELATRRANVAREMSDKSMLVLFSPEPRVYSGDVDFMYRQENNLYYLTNLKQTNATLVLIKNGANVQEILFLPKRNPQFETWNGKMYGSEDATRISGIKTIVDANEFESFLESVKTKKAFSSKDNAVSSQMTAQSLYLLLPSSENDTVSAREYLTEGEFVKDFAKITNDEKTRAYKYESLLGYEIKNASPIFSKLRLVKSPMEIKLMQHAIDITTEAQTRAMATVGQANFEYEVQAEVEYIFRRRNADYWGYPSIVGCGPNATTLHYVESQGAINKTDLLLMDVGAEYDHYTADVTRTFPVNGKFTKEQKDIYQVVYDAQEAAAKTIKPGARFAEPAQAAAKVIEEGLAKLGLITAIGAFIPGTEQTVPDGKGGTRVVGIPQYRVWYMHGWGHWLGMNVHDVGGGGNTILQPGMIMTNEPGIYIREDALDYFDKSAAMQEFLNKIRPAFEKYKNVGVRIEDDMLVTQTGVEWMTKNLPRSIADVETLMAQASKEIKISSVPRNSNPNSAVLNFQTYYSAANDLVWNPLDAENLMNGKTIRQGWIWTGKNTAYSGLSHVEHSHGE